MVARESLEGRRGAASGSIEEGEAATRSGSTRLEG